MAKVHLVEQGCITYAARLGPLWNKARGMGLQTYLILARDPCQEVADQARAVKRIASFLYSF